MIIRPPCAHQRRRRPDGGRHAADIDGEQPVEGGRSSGRIIDCPDYRDAGVVDQDVEAAKMFKYRLDQTLNLGGIGLVGLEGRGPDALGLKFLNDRLSLVGRGHVADGDVGAVVGEGPRRRRADAPRAAGDQGTLPASFLDIV